MTKMRGLLNYLVILYSNYLFLHPCGSRASSTSRITSEDSIRPSMSLNHFFLFSYMISYSYSYSISVLLGVLCFYFSSLSLSFLYILAASNTSVLNGNILGKACYFFPPRLIPVARSFLAVLRVFFLCSFTFLSILYLCFRPFLLEGFDLALLENLPIIQQLDKMTKITNF